VSTDDDDYSGEQLSGPPMGYLIVIGPCFGCGKVFAFSAQRVPSVVVEGDRRPVCADCIEHVNPMRVANGLPLFTPLPGAYEAGEE